MASLSDALVQQLLQGRYIGTLATESPNGSIHMVAVWFHFEGTKIFVATSSRSRKARNLKTGSKISLMIDSRDPSASFGATIAGTAEILNGDAAQKRNAQVHHKYLSPAALADPRVGPVFAVWDDIAIQITPASVIAWDMRVLDQQVLGSAFEQNPSYLLPLER
ncbi:MAG TPA: pyridoxamine 5'-phosphate oxidase family protein [Candidatus Solibacter sp.]|nr:pyridoxamine 5'-phosphate oxidase family protein [Candidatus Solibacter sp.]